MSRLSALKKTHFVPWTPALNACPSHPHCEMRAVHILGREFWECPHPDHITGELQPVAKQPSGGLLISPIRARAARRVDDWREVRPPAYQLPPPQSTGPMKPIVSITPLPATMADIEAPVEMPATPMKRPAWVDDLLRHGVQETPRWLVDEPADSNWMNAARPVDVTPEDCAPVLDDGDATMAREDQGLYQLRLLARRSESE